eukprot:3657666-Prorocentrum_lima.AAC.1
MRRAGWGFVLQFAAGDTILARCGVVPGVHQTAYLGEAMAVLETLQVMQSQAPNTKLLLYSDCQAVVDGW